MITRLYICLKCGHEQERNTALFAPGQAPLCIKCSGVLKRLKGAAATAASLSPDQWTDSPAAPRAPANPAEPCPFD